MASYSHLMVLERYQVTWVAMENYTLFGLALEALVLEICTACYIRNHLQLQMGCSGTIFCSIGQGLWPVARGAPRKHH